MVVNKKLIIAVLAVIVAAIIGYLIYFNFFTFSVKSTSPVNTRVSTSAPVIRIHTTKELSDAKISFADGGTEIVSSVTQSGSTIIVNLFQQLVADKTYTITLTNITSKDGNKIATYVYTFTPKDNDDYLSDEDVKIILERQNDKGEILGDPVYNETPIVSDAYIIKSTLNASPDGKGTVSLQVTIYPTREDIPDYDRAISRYKDQVIERLQKIKGFTVEKYPITYTIQEP